jgi:hypothetical protein
MKHLLKIHSDPGCRFSGDADITDVFYLVDHVAREIGHDTRWGIDRHFSAFFMLIISNKINKLAIFIQRGVNVGSNASPNWVRASWRVVRSKTLSPTRVSKSEIFTDVGLRHAQQGGGITNAVGCCDDGNNF